MLFHLKGNPLISSVSDENNHGHGEPSQVPLLRGVGGLPQQLRPCLYGPLGTGFYHIVLKKLPDRAVEGESGAWR